MALVEAVIQATSIILEVLIVLAVIGIVGVVATVGYLVGERYGHKDIGFAVGILLALWLVLIVVFY